VLWGNVVGLIAKVLFIEDTSFVGGIARAEPVQACIEGDKFAVV
jgi:hypothetical protein